MTPRRSWTETLAVGVDQSFRSTWFVVLVVLVVIALSAWSWRWQRDDCRKRGGRVVEGFVGGHWAILCVDQKEPGGAP